MSLDAQARLLGVFFTVSVVLLGLAVFRSEPVQAQSDVVAKYRAQYGTPVGSENLAKMMRQIAGELNLGVLRKDSGNTCGNPPIACDIICNPRTGEHWDVLGDAEGAARVQWGFVGIIDRERCIAVNPEPPPPPPPPPPGDLQARVERLERQMAALAAAARTP